jgi:hypothetical protein
MNVIETGKKQLLQKKQIPVFEAVFCALKRVIGRRRDHPKQNRVFHSDPAVIFPTSERAVPFRNRGKIIEKLFRVNPAQFFPLSLKNRECEVVIGRFVHKNIFRALNLRFLVKRFRGFMSGPNEIHRALLEQHPFVKNEMVSSFAKNRTEHVIGIDVA